MQAVHTTSLLAVPSLVEVPRGQLVYTRHSRSLVAVFTLDSYWVARHVVRSEHMRSLVPVGTLDMYWLVAVHCVNVLHSIALVLVGALVCHSPARQLPWAEHMRLLVAVGATSSCSAAAQAVVSVQTRSWYCIAMWYWYWVAVHDVTALHTRSEMVVGEASS